MATLVTSYNPTTAGSVDSRTADSLVWTFTAKPQAMSLYIKMQERGTIHTASGFVVWIGTTAITAPYVGIQAAGGLYRAVYDTEFTAARTSTLAAAPAVGQMVELLLTLTGAGVVQLQQSIAGAAVTAATAATASVLPPAWSAQRLVLGGASTVVGALAVLNLIVVRGVQDMAAMRRLAGTATR